MAPTGSVPLGDPSAVPSVEPPVAPGTCAVGQTLCDGQCAILGEDLAHCGACGNVCPLGSQCVQGACGCGAGLLQCGAECVDVQTNALHCGACDQPCGASQGCSAGACACPTGYGSCGGQCVDTAVDVAHCGACDAACVSGQNCLAGACECLAGLTSCTGACSQIQEDPLNCGACGTVCAAAEVCSLGACAAGCAEGLLQCGQSCTDSATSINHCGACDNACPAGQSCVGGVCSCADGQTACDGQCVDLGSSLANCGGCGIACTGGSSCVAGACACPAGLTLCGGQCVDTATTLAHCGVCDNACEPGGGCSAGTCSCPEGSALCDGQCRDTVSNELHCGGCGNVCLTGECVTGACPRAKDCAAQTALVDPVFSDFEDYDGVTPVGQWAFTFNGESGASGAIYSGPYEYSDETGMQALSMPAGNGSPRAIDVSATNATDWGGGFGFWMSCIDASAYDGIAFWAKGSTPTGEANFTLSMEDTSPPAADDPAAGGTCTAAAAECVGPGATFAVTDTWTRVLLPWSAFTPGTAGTTMIPATGSEITGFAFNLNLAYGEDPAAPGMYIAMPGSYQLSIDDVEFFVEAGSCAEGERVCSAACVNPMTNASHCGGCGNACSSGRSCIAGECACAAGETFCAESCVDVQSDPAHCGACGNVCALSATCSAGACSGGNATSSDRCGSTMTLLGSPFGCDFAWGANPNGAIPNYLNFASKWVGYEQNINSTCDGCTWLQSFGASNVVPMYIAYFIAYRGANAGFGDCNTDFDGQNLCNNGAQFIRDNRSQLIDIYESYAQRSYAAYPSKPVVWLIDPDFIQYTYEEQSNPLSMAELGQLATDIVCAVKANMPNAVIAFNHSTWVREPTFSQYWSALPLDLADFVHTTGVANAGGYFNTGDANNRQDGSYRYLHQLTGKPLIVDTSFGVSTQADSWSVATAATLNERIADGVAGILISPTPASYDTRIAGFSGLDSVCQ